MPRWLQMTRRWSDGRRHVILGYVSTSRARRTSPVNHGELFLSKGLTAKLAKEHVLTDALQIYRKLSTDDQDSVRLLTVEDLIAIARKLEPAEVKEQLLISLKSSVSDKSWRVRYMVADHFVQVSHQTWATTLLRTSRP